MSHIGYNQTKSATPEKWVDDGYCAVVSGSLTIICGLTQVDSLSESGTGVITLNLSGLVSVLSVIATGVDSGVSNLSVSLVSVSNSGTNAAGNPSTQIILQVYDAGSKANLSATQGICISIAFTKSHVLNGKALQRGMISPL